MMITKSIWLCFLTAAWAIFCATAPATAQPLETITIGFPSRSMTELPNQIAVVKGFYREEGLDVRLVQARSNILVAALASGSMDYITSVNSSISGIMSGVPAKVVAIITRNNPDYLMAKPEIRSLKELKGKTLAVSAFGGSSHQRLLIILNSAGIDPKADVSILSVGEAKLRLEQLRLGAIDATVLTAPHNFIAERAGFRTLGSSKDILPLPAVGMATLEKRIKERPDQVKKLLRAVLKAMVFIRQNRDETVQKAMEWLALDRDLAARSYDAMLPNYAFDGTMDRGQLAQYVQLVSQRQPRATHKTFSLADVADFSMVEQARREIEGR
jgi:ABC-type nitrate/sulfonate/bicarbonate transport system substrate-binding protein